MLGSSRIWKRRPLGFAAALMSGALVLAGCAGGGTPAQNGAQGADQESADSGEITWWGWTPDAAPAEAYIKAFNKVYPNIKVTFRSSPSTATTRPSARRSPRRSARTSSTSPPARPTAPSTSTASNAIDLKPAVEKTLGADWESKLAPIGVSEPEERRQAGRPVGRLGLLRHGVDQQGPVRQVPPSSRRPTTTSGRRSARPSRPTTSDVSSRARPRPRSTRTPSRRSPTTSSRASGRRPSRRRCPGPTRRSSRR